MLVGLHLAGVNEDNAINDDDNDGVNSDGGGGGNDERGRCRMKRIYTFMKWMKGTKNNIWIIFYCHE